MKGLSRQLAIAVVALSVMMTGLVTPAGAGARAYTKYAACRLKISAPPRHLCHRSVSNRVGVFFRSNTKTVFYSVQVRFPGGAVRGLRGERAPKGVFSRAAIQTNILGVHTVSWFVKGQRVGTWRFRLVR